MQTAKDLKIFSDDYLTTVPFKQLETMRSIILYIKQNQSFTPEYAAKVAKYIEGSINFASIFASKANHKKLLLGNPQWPVNHLGPRPILDFI